MSQPTFYPLEIAELRPETDQALTVVFKPGPEHGETFAYHPGQYLTLRFVVNGKEERRAYSMCSAPHDDEVAVTVKRLRGGIVSNHIADRLKPGDTVEVMPPDGRFLLKTDPAARRDIYLFGAGSGITPLMSILRSVLENEPKSHVYLLYGNRDEDNIIFSKQLEELERKYAGQLTVVHTLTSPRKSVGSGLMGLFRRNKTTWKGKRGRIDMGAVNQFLDDHPGTAEIKEHFICGPGEMIDVVEESLELRSVPKQHIHLERFASPNDVRAAANNSGGAAGAKVVAKVSGKEYNLTLKPGQSILDALIETGANPPYSCLAGACSTCMAKVEKGGVKMEVCYALDDEEVAEGFILTCQSFPTTDEVIVNFDV